MSLKRGPTRVVAFLLMSFLLWEASVFIGVETTRTSASSQTMQEIAKVAVYNGPGVWQDSKTAIIDMLEWANASVTIVDADAILNGSLINFDLLVVPGGWAWDNLQDLGSDGASKIRDYVRNGGTYMGICAGAWFACDSIIWQETQMPGYEVDLFPGRGVGPLEAIPWQNGYGYNMTKINIVNHTHPITASLPDYMWILYYGGPEFHAYEGANVTVLGTYDVNGQPAMVAFEYGSGRVFLTGPHPEIEEDNMRDAVDEDSIFPPLDYPRLDDPDSDWPLLLGAFKWLIPDTDGDRIPDVRDADDDDDGMSDAWEINNGLDPLDATDATLDPDNDGLTNLQEYQGGTDPYISDVEPFPWWIVGIAGVVVAAGIAAGALVLWRRRRPLTSKGSSSIDHAFSNIAAKRV